MILPVIMAGGTGSRLWPMSRELYPKQFLNLYGNNSMLQETINRISGLPLADPIVICNQEHRFLVAEQLRQLHQLSNNIILEPAGRNTAPAIALAAFQAIANGDDPVLLVLAADHVVENDTAFRNVVEQALPYAEQGNMVTFGIVPSSPETGYGYIQRGDIFSDATDTVFSIKRFVEKPDYVTAKNYVESGEYYWNSGMFLFKASQYLSELKQYRPDIYQACERAMNIKNADMDFIKIDKEAFLACPDESVDYAVMENTSRGVVVPLDAGWNDVGSWSALWEVNEKDEQENVSVGDVYLHDTHSCYVHTDEKLVAALGVDNLVIVSTKDAVLVVDKSKVQDVKKAVEYLKDNSRSEYRIHRESYLPWGKRDVVVNTPRYNVNYVTIDVGGKFSQQKHHHRAEHWIVLSGTAEVTLNDQTFLLTENQSTFIPVGAVHMLSNPGRIPLEVLEIQSGDYLGDDDIVRLKDHYGII